MPALATAMSKIDIAAEGTRSTPSGPGATPPWSRPARESASNVATTRPPWARIEAAFVAALPASTQPSSATTTAGSLSSGSWRRSLYRVTSRTSRLGPPRRGRADDRLLVPVGADRREHVDDDGALGPGQDRKSTRLNS